MLGAILGDIIGSRFEFDRGDKTKDFDLFGSGCKFTDDTVMTVAVAEALMKVGIDASVEEIEKAVTESMQDWGHRYPNEGYGAHFGKWLKAGKDAKPYYSYGNGSAMRVSAAGWLYDSLERTREVARATANVSHNHPEGLMGAECTAAVIFMARNGFSKEEIRDYVVKEFGYDLSKSIDELRPLHRHNETCMDSLPKALLSFLEGNSIEDVIRNAVSLGGDTDTIAAIAGSMAEGMYEVPDGIKKECSSRITEDIAAVINNFAETIKPANQDSSIGDERVKITGVNKLKLQVSILRAESNDMNFMKVFDVLCDSYVWVPCKALLSDTDSKAVKRMLDELDGDYTQLEEKTFTTQDQVRLIPDILYSGDDFYFPIFSSAEEMGEYGNNYSKIEKHILEVIPLARNNDKNVKGLVLDAFTGQFILSRDLFDYVETWYS